MSGVIVAGLNLWRCQPGATRTFPFLAPLNFSRFRPKSLTYAMSLLRRIENAALPPARDSGAGVCRAVSSIALPVPELPGPLLRGRGPQVRAGGCSAGASRGTALCGLNCWLKQGSERRPYKTSAKPRFICRKNRPPITKTPTPQAAAITRSCGSGIFEVSRTVR